MRVPRNDCGARKRVNNAQSALLRAPATGALRKAVCALSWCMRPVLGRSSTTVASGRVSSTSKRVLAVFPSSESAGRMKAWLLLSMSWRSDHRPLLGPSRTPSSTALQGGRRRDRRRL